MGRSGISRAQLRSSIIASKIASRYCSAKDPKWFALSAPRSREYHKGGTHSGRRRLRRLSSRLCWSRGFETLPIRIASRQPCPSSRFPDVGFLKLRARKVRTVGATTQRKRPVDRLAARFGDMSRREVLAVRSSWQRGGRTRSQW